MQLCDFHQAYRDFCSCRGLRNGFYGRLMLDVSSGIVWCDVFTDPNSFKRYHSRSIVSVEDFYPYVEASYCSSLRDMAHRACEIALDKGGYFDA